MFTTSFIPSKIIQEYNFFLDESDSELNPMADFIDQRHSPKRLYIQQKCEFKMINGILNGGTIQVDFKFKVLRFLGYSEQGSVYPIKPPPFMTKWSNLIDLSDNIETKFLFTDFPTVPENKWYFFMRSEILNYLFFGKYYKITTIDTIVISIKESNVINNVKLHELITLFSILLLIFKIKFTI